MRHGNNSERDQGKAEFHSALMNSQGVAGSTSQTQHFSQNGGEWKKMEGINHKLNSPRKGLAKRVSNGQSRLMNGLRWLPQTFFVLFWCYPTSITAQSQDKDLAAIVGGVPISRTELEEAIAPQKQMMRFQLRNDPTELEKQLRELPAKALEGLIDRELLLAEFRKLGGELKPQYVDDDIDSIIRESFAGNRDAFIKELERTGITLERFRDLREKMIIVQVMRGRLADDLPIPTPEEIKEFYTNHRERFKEEDEIKIRTITILKNTEDAATSAESNKKRAIDLRRQLLEGTDFVKLAKAYSQDNRAEEGGAWPWIKVTEVKKSIADAVASLDKGALSEPIEDETAFILLKVDGKKAGARKSLKEARPEIEELMRLERNKSALDSWLREARKNTHIERFN
jgi:parvulin-like peptidyl-prolyl isomerase